MILELLFGVSLIVLALIMMFSVILSFWAIYDCLKRPDFPTEERLAWAMLISFFTVIGSIIYLILSRILKRRITRPNSRTLYLSENKVIAGVCGGLAEFFDMSPGFVRIGWIFMTIISLGTGIFAYIVAWIVLAKAKKEYYSENSNYSPPK